MKHPLNRTGKLSAAANSKPSFKLVMTLLFISSLVLLALSGQYWYRNVFSNNDRVLTDMLNKSLQTSSVSRTVAQGEGLSKKTQHDYLSFSPSVLTQSLITVEQSSSQAKTIATVESIGTKDNDFVKYTDVTVEGRQNENADSYKNALNVWAKQDSNPESGQQVSNLNTALFMIVPFGNLNNAQRNEMLAEAKKLDLYAYKDAKKEFVNGRPIITYSMDLQPQKLAAYLAKYVTVSGVGDASEYNPQLYEGVEATPIKLQVDLLSRHVSSIEFVSGGDFSQKETYTAYNMSRQVELPKETITFSELQQKLVQSQQGTPKQ